MSSKRRHDSKPRFGGELLNCQLHHRMNFPHSVVRHVFATVVLLLRCMTYVPHRFPNNCNDRRLTEFQRLRRARVKRKPCGSPTKNSCANLAPLRFCWYFTDNDAGLVTSYIVQRDVKVASSSARKSTTRPVRDTISVQTGWTATGFALSGSPQPAIRTRLPRPKNARSSDLI